MSMAPTDQSIPEDVTPAPRTEPKKEFPMKKMSTFQGVMLAAMADELAHMPKEKVAINLAPVGQFLGNMAGRAATAAPQMASALEGVGSHALGGLTNMLGQHGGQLGQRAVSGIMGAAPHVGGVQNLSRLAGAGVVGAGLGGAALGGAMLGRATAPQQR